MDATFEIPPPTELNSLFSRYLDPAIKAIAKSWDENFAANFVDLPPSPAQPPAMLASELITALQEAIAAHGDHPVRLDSDEWSSDVGSVVFDARNSEFEIEGK